MKIRQCFLELQLKMSGMFFETQCIIDVLNIRAGLRHWEAHAKGSWGPSPSFPTHFRLSPPSPTLSSFPIPPVPSSALLLPSSSLPLRSRPLNTAMGLGERCKLPQWGLGQSPSRQMIWCVFESKTAALVAAIFV